MCECEAKNWEQKSDIYGLSDDVSVEINWDVLQLLMPDDDN